MLTNLSQEEIQRVIAVDYDGIKQHATQTYNKI